MFSQSLSRAARSTTPLLHSNPAAAAASRNGPGYGVASNTSASSSHSRRHSSSKASTPPGNGDRSAEAAANNSEASRSPSEPEKRASGRIARRKPKDSADQVAAKTKDEAFANMPAVPFTHHLKEDDVKLSSFFALHRPISVTSPFPSQSTTAKSFSSIFDAPKSSSSNRINDTIYTLNNAVSALENHSSSARRARTSIPHTPEEKDLRWEIIQQSSNNSENAQHIDNPPSLESLVRNFRPFNVPPAPVPIEHKTSTMVKATTHGQMHNEGLSERIEKSQRKARRRTYATTLTIEEATDMRGETTYTASASPIVRIPSIRRRGFQVLSARSVDDAAAQEGVGVTGRMEQQLPHGRIRPREMLLISVKRQRKLKMKKHKYKKLMRKTRNLRRRQGRD